jgi:hypothetical protein
MPLLSIPKVAAANTRWSRQRLRRSLYRGFFALLVHLFSEPVPPTRRCGSAFPLARCNGKHRQCSSVSQKQRGSR